MSCRRFALCTERRTAWGECMMKKLCVALLLVALFALPVFADNATFRYTENADGTLTVTGYTGYLSDLSLPETIDGKTVTAIGEYAFANQTELVSVSLPESVTIIGAHAFYGCARLVRASLAATDIGVAAFADCVALREVSLGKNLVTIEDAAFENCRMLGKLTIPATLTAIGTDAFSGCEQVRFLATENTYAQEFAAANGIPLSFWETDTFRMLAPVIGGVALALLGLFGYHLWKKKRT